MELKDKLGPINWQFAPIKKFEPKDFESFLNLLPKKVAGRPIRHTIEVWHPTFQSPDFIALTREHNVAIVVAGDSPYPQIGDVTADFVYARIMGSREDGYPAAALDTWAARVRTWAAGGVPKDLETFAREPAAVARRDVFLYVISGAKTRNPAAAMALTERLRSL